MSSYGTVNYDFAQIAVDLAPVIFIPGVLLCHKTRSHSNGVWSVGFLCLFYHHISHITHVTFISGVLEWIFCHDDGYMV